MPVVFSGQRIIPPQAATILPPENPLWLIRPNTRLDYHIVMAPTYESIMYREQIFAVCATSLEHPYEHVLMLSYADRFSYGQPRCERCVREITLAGMRGEL